MSDPKRRQQSPRSRPRGAPRGDPTGPQRTGSGLHPSVEADGAERWVSGKTEEELLGDLRAYLARLRDDPHNIQDRLRVAAIQLRLGRVDEALIHYEGVVRGYVSHGQIMSAIALCERILGIYPDLAHLQKLLAALYARAPRGSVGPTAVTPIAEEVEETPFVVAESTPAEQRDDPEDAPTERSTVVDRLFSPSPTQITSELTRTSLLDDEELRPTMRFAQELGPSADDGGPVVLLTQPKGDRLEGDRLEGDRRRAEIVETNDTDDDGAPVVLLTQPKRKP